MPEPVTVTSAQLDAILSTIARVATHPNGWDWHNGIPTAIGAFLGFGAVQLQERLRTGREKRKEVRKRREDELAQLGATIAALLFNLESVIHTVMQQVLPHYKASRAGMNVFMSAAQQSIHPSVIHGSIQNFLSNVFCRAPEPHLVEIDAFGDLSFLLTKHAELVKQCGWVGTFTRDLRFILGERNKLVDVATLGAPKAGHDQNEVQFQMRTQLSVSKVEMVTSYQLLDVIVDTVDSLLKVQSSDYSGVDGPKLKIIYPSDLPDVRADLQKALETEGLWDQIVAASSRT